MNHTVAALSLRDFKSLITETTCAIIDSRPVTLFTQGFIPASVSIGLEGRFAEWAGNLLPLAEPVAIVAQDGSEEETAAQLRRVGFSNIRGYLDGGFEAWKASGEPVDMIINVDADELAMDIPFDDRLVVIDVRRETEFGDGHVAEAINIPLSDLVDPASMGNIEEDQNLYIHCATGYRSVIAASLFKRQGIHNLRNVTGGFESIKQQEKIEIIKENRVLN